MLKELQGLRAASAEDGERVFSYSHFPGVIDGENMEALQASRRVT